MRKKLIVPIVILAIGAIGFLVWAQNGASTPPSPENFAPNFWFDSDEKYFPADPLDFYYENGEEIEGEKAIAKYNSLSLSEKLSKFKVFYTIKDQSNEWVYEYWVFYVMNDYENGHYGDWESVFVFVDKNKGKINKLVASAHGLFNNELSPPFESNRMWVYVGDGSHANCPDKIADGKCNFHLWNFGKQGQDWDKNGPKIYHNQYVFKEFNNDFIQNFKGQKSFDKEKSPTLGINLYKFFKLDKLNISTSKENIYTNLPVLGEMFGKTPEHAWYQPQYDNPELIRPFTNVALEKAQNFGQSVANGIKNGVQTAFNEIKFIFSQINPFQAGLAPNIGQTFQIENKEIGNGAEENNFVISESDNLFALQDQLDDAAERMDVLNQKSVDLLAQNNIKKDLIENNKEESKEILKEETQNEEDVQDEEEEAQNNEEDILQDEVKTTIPKLEQKLCEKSVDNFPKRDKVIINEIAWMGTEVSTDDEWIELKNISSEPISLNGWQLVDKDKQIKVVSPQVTVPANGFFLLERTNDDTILDVKADLIYQGGLNNNKEALFLFDANCQLVDEVIANAEWPMGDNNSKKTMERKMDFNWQTSERPGGTPKKENSVGFVANTIGFDAGGGGGGNTAERILAAPSPKILITEIQTSDANSSNNDFIEIYNLNATSTDISDWQLKKKNSNGAESSIRVFPDNSIIAPGNYFIWMNSDYAVQSAIAADATSSQTLANNNSLALLDESRNIIDQVAWGTSTDAFLETAAFSENPTDIQTLGRKWSTTTQNYIDADDNQNDFELQSPTPKAQNQSPEPEPEPEPEEPNFSVVINEIAWMGTNSQNSSDEWIELYNNTNSEVDLTGWKILKNGENFINLATTTIAGASFYLLERTDSTTTNVVENQVYTGSLSNSGEKLELRNASNTLIDLIDVSTGWPAGTTSPAYISMERIVSNASGTDSANWANNNLITRNGIAANGANINGTPASQNSVSKVETNVASLPFDEFDEITLTALGNPYTIQNTLQVSQNKKLIIEPAVTLKFYIPDVYGPNEGAYLKIDGALEAIGEQGQEILFTSTGATWPGIVFESATAETATSSVMEYVKIEKARSWEANIYSAVKITNKAVSIKNSTFENNSNLKGLYLLNSSSTIENVVFNNFNASSSNAGTGEYPSGIFIDAGNPIIKNNTFNNNYQGIIVGTTETCLQNPGFIISGNTFNSSVIPIYITNTGFPCFGQNQITDSQRDNFSNLFNGIVYKGDSMEQDNLWQSDSPIILEKGFSVQNATLTIAAGVIIKFKHSSDVSPNTYLKINSGSRLIGQGAAGNLVVFTSNQETPTAGNWQAIWFADGSSGELNFTKISYGGFGAGPFRNECLIVDSTDVVLNSVEKEFCEPY